MQLLSMLKLLFDLKNRTFIPTIGLEIHVQLATKSKIFCEDATKFDADSNTQIGIISLAYPGALPKLNKEVVEMAVKVGLALNSEIASQVVFDRKHYFYPDSPKGYQLTQNTLPICKGGAIELELPNGKIKKVYFHQIHLEDDAGKSIHEPNSDFTLIDLNRAGMPLIEMVTNPNLSSAEEVGVLLEEVRKIVRFLGVSDGNMEQGSLRCDANISIRLNESEPLGKKVEIKNMNSIRFIKKAIDYEIERQSELLANGIAVEQESRLFDADKGITLGMRDKEDANDYRYYPDPDLVPFEIKDDWLSGVKANMPKLPKQLKSEFILKYGLTTYDASVLSDSLFLSSQFIHLMEANAAPKRTANWLMGPVQAWFKEQTTEPRNLPITSLSKAINWVEEGKLTSAQGIQQLLPALLNNYELNIEQFAQQNNLFLSADTDELLDEIISVLDKYNEEVKRYKQGKKGLLQLFVGKVMGATKSKYDPKQVIKKIQEMLNKTS